VDDGSEDDTCDIVKEYKEERIKLTRAGRTGVNGKVKNIGLSKATGDFIAFLDHDDLWAPDKLEKQVNALLQHPEAGFSLTGGYNFRVPGKSLEYFYSQTEGERAGNFFLSFFRSQLPGFTQALVIRKECLEVAGSFDETRAFSDTAFILKIARHFKGVILYEPLVFRRLHDANHNQANWQKGFEEGIEIIRSYKDIVPPEIINDALFRAYINWGEESLKNKKMLHSMHQFLKAWTIKPFSFIPLKKTARLALPSFRR
jgi:glycosyltransferase involved in cell wall biosynthesis